MVRVHTNKLLVERKPVDNHTIAHVGMWILNVDAKHPDSKALPKPGFRTDFMQKWLVNPPAAAVVEPGGAERDETAALKGSEAEQTWTLMSPAAYCDPRGV